MTRPVKILMVGVAATLLTAVVCVLGSFAMNALLPRPFVSAYGCGIVSSLLPPIVGVLTCFYIDISGNSS